MSILHLSCSQKLCCPQNVQSNPHEWFRVIETATAQDQNPDCKTQIYALQVQTDSITAETGVTVSWIQSKSCGGFAAPLLADWSVSSCLSHFYLLKQIRCESNSVLISPEENGVPPDSMTNPVFLTSLQGKWLASTHCSSQKWKEFYFLYGNFEFAFIDLTFTQLSQHREATKNGMHSLLTQCILGNDGVISEMC